ncbi:MAG TPA: M56 family metallopeptidase, partial [Verrucomicrobia bacterium]|nr:M56 family metallopeptidase [Verrucomicrobiota bacterium]
MGSPFVCGLRNPVIFLPASLLEKLSQIQLKTVFVHEVTHVKRLDIWTNSLQSVLQIIYWWNPLVW